jgi:hypothetical protein
VRRPSGVYWTDRVSNDDLKAATPVLRPRRRLAALPACTEKQGGDHADRGARESWKLSGVPRRYRRGKRTICGKMTPTRWINRRRSPVPKGSASAWQYGADEAWKRQHNGCTAADAVVLERSGIGCISKEFVTRFNRID